FLGTEFGLWISVDGGAHWAQFKGGHLPAVAVRDLAIQPRDNDLVLATHGRGIWIVDDITPLRQLTPQLISQEAAFVSARPEQQRLEANGGWVNGAAAFVGDTPARGAVITYYQRTRHLFGKLRIEVLDASGELIDELPASTRRGLNRVVWTMHRRAPQVPPAAQLAFAGTQGPRVLPGTYTIRLHKNDKVYESQVAIGLDTRVKWTPADRKAQYEAAMKVYALFNEESALFGRIAGMREQVAEAGRGRPQGEALLRRLGDFDGSSMRSGRRSSPPRKVERSPGRSGCASTPTSCTVRSPPGMAHPRHTSCRTSPRCARSWARSRGNSTASSPASCPLSTMR